MYRKQTNYVTKLKKQSIHLYIIIARELGIESSSQDMASPLSIRAIKENTPEYDYICINLSRNWTPPPPLKGPPELTNCLQ